MPSLARARALKAEALLAAGRLRYQRRYGFAPPPPWSDITGYEPMLDALRDLDVPGDVLEIGVFLGGGTYKLARTAPERQVIAVDIFDLDFDRTESDDGTTMADVYGRHIRAAGLSGSQRSIFDGVIAGLPNVTAIAGDSTLVSIPSERLAFSFIDGHHSAEYVRKDFEMAWSRTPAGGIVALHDYGRDLPSVTHTVNALIGEHAEQVARIWTAGITVFLQRER